MKEAMLVSECRKGLPSASVCPLGWQFPYLRAFNSCLWAAIYDNEVKRARAKPKHLMFLVRIQHLYRCIPFWAKFGFWWNLSEFDLKLFKARRGDSAWQAEKLLNGWPLVRPASTCRRVQHSNRCHHSTMQFAS
eukprot:2666998-Amphidinium_carterae.1